MSKQMDKELLDRALRHQFPTAAKVVLNPGDQVLV